MGSLEAAGGKTVRFVASGGYADQDREVVADLLAKGRILAERTVAAPSAPPELQALAHDLLEAIASDTL